MATITFGKNGTRPYCTLAVTEQSQSVANNTTTVKYVLTLVRPSAVTSSATKTWSCTINGTKHSGTGTIGGSGNKILLQGTQTIKHNNDGTKTISFSGSCQLDITWSGVQLGTITGSGTMTLTTIPRYASVNQALSAKTETTATIKWTSDSVVDYIWYSVNNGSTWTGINVTDGTSGSYTISGLTADTTYQIKILKRILSYHRRSDHYSPHRYRTLRVRFRSGTGLRYNTHHRYHHFYRNFYLRYKTLLRRQTCEG